MWRFAAPVLAYGLALAGCQKAPPPAPPPGPPKFFIGNAFQSLGEWRYPQLFNNYDATGLATVFPADYPAYTVNNEPYDPQALAAASPVLQLPAIVTVTNLLNGYSVDVRVNERGPNDPGRLLEVTPRVAALLGFQGDIAEVEVTLQGPRTDALDASLGQGLKLTAAPMAGITAQSLGAPGDGGPGAVQNLTPRDTAVAGSDPGALSGAVTVTTPGNGPLFVQIPGFGRLRDANEERDQLYGMSAFVMPVFGGDRTLYAVRIGPFQAVADADAALQALLQRGVSDPEIIVH